MKRYLIAFAVSLGGCTMYQNPDMNNHLNVDGTELSDKFYNLPKKPSATIDDGGNYDVTDFDN